MLILDGSASFCYIPKKSVVDGMCRIGSTAKGQKTGSFMKEKKMHNVDIRRKKRIPLLDEFSIDSFMYSSNNSISVCN